MTNDFYHFYLNIKILASIYNTFLLRWIFLTYKLRFKVSCFKVVSSNLILDLE